MNLADKYSNTTESKPGLVVLSDDAYAICEYIEKLMSKIEHLWRLNG